MNSNDTASTRITQFGDSACTCKLCNHRIASDCM